MFYDRNRNASNIQALSQALANSNKGDVRITPFQPTQPYPSQQTQAQESNTGMGDLAKATTPLLKTGISKFGDFMGGLGDNSNSSSAITNATNSFVNDTNYNDYGISSAINSNVTDTAFNDGSIAGEIGNNVGGGFGGDFGGGGLGWIGMGKGLMNGLQQGFESANDPDRDTYWGGVGNGIQGFFNVDDENQSDIEQAISGSLSGASKGMMFGPWGAVIGGLLGLGSSFIDDFGGSDDNEGEEV